MSRAVSGTLHCRVGVSGRMLAFSACVHGSALVVVLALALSRPLLLLLVPVIASSHCCSHGRIRMSWPGSVRELRWIAANQWIWRRRDGRELHGRLVGATVIAHHVVVLRLRAEQCRPGSATICLVADSLDPDTHRRLRARLTPWRPERHEGRIRSLFRERLSALRNMLRRIGD